MIFLQMTVSGAALILLIVLLRMMAVNWLPKDTFLILWGIVLIRLLVPLSVPSAHSIYSLIDRSASWNVYVEGSDEVFSGEISEDSLAAESPSNHETAVTAQEQGVIGTQEQAKMGTQDGMGIQAYDGRKPFGQPFFLLFIGWCMGTFALLLFFLSVYLRGLFCFRTSLPVQEAYVEEWLREHPLKRSVSIRQSDRITAPLTCGLFRPVILMPKKNDWNNTIQLEYVLLHEYVHICRFDAVIKLIIVLALCIHWFNPFVWALYVLFNRDLELSCDEKVLRRFGETERAAYARTLIDMAAVQSGFIAFGNHFGRNAVEERVVAIMKWREASFYKKLLAAVLIVGVLAVFAASTLTMEVSAVDNEVSAAKDMASLPDTDFTEEEYAKLLALQFDGYEDMSVAQYQEKVWAYTDTVPYRNLLERFSQCEALYAARNDNETAAFLFYVLEPLTAEKWQKRDFGGYVLATGSSASDENSISDNAMLEYDITLSLKMPEALTVRAYDEARKGMINGLADFLRSRTKEQLQDEGYMERAILTQIDVLKQRWSTDAMDILVEYEYMPLTVEKENSEEETEQEDAWDEPRINGYATEEDYRSLFILRTADYQQMSVADFNKALLDWGDENFGAYERIREDYYKSDYRVELSEEELFFIGITMNFSGEENYRKIQSLKTGRPEEAPEYRSYLMEKAIGDGIAWCGFDYEFTYRLSDKNAVTIAMRDEQLSGVVRDINDFWEETSLEELLQMAKEDILKKLNEIAVKYSNEWIQITIDEERLYFESMDERAYLR